MRFFLYYIYEQAHIFISELEIDVIHLDLDTIKQNFAKIHYFLL